jgi:hypothetical protein
MVGMRFQLEGGAIHDLLCREVGSLGLKDKVIIGIDMEAAGTGPGGNADFTGKDTSVGGGSNIRIEMKNIDTVEGQQIDRIYMTLVHNVIAVLEERGGHGP